MPRNAVVSRFPIPTIAAAAVLYGLLIAACEAKQPAAPTPTLTIDEAIDTAKRCVLERKVHLDGHVIESARLERNPSGDRAPNWLVTWAYFRQVKGGQVFVTVFPTRACEITYGE